MDERTKEPAKRKPFCPHCGVATDTFKDFSVSFGLLGGQATGIACPECKAILGFIARP